MAQTTPRIVVLISAYNAEKTIQYSLDSLQTNQEPHDIVIVDDGSSLPLESYLTAQPNLKIIRAPQNLGVSGARNLGLKYIYKQDYEYIAFLDADDTATPDRLFVEREYLDQHPEIGFVGSWGRFISEKGQTVFHLNPPEKHDEIIKKFYYNNCFVHSSLMIRVLLLKKVGAYSEEYPSAEDYEMLQRLMRHAKAATLPKYLINYTISTAGISLMKRGEQLNSRLKIQWTYRNWLSIHFYLGIIKTLFVSLLPYQLITTIKKNAKGYKKL